MSVRSLRFPFCSSIMTEIWVFVSRWFFYFLECVVCVCVYVYDCEVFKLWLVLLNRFQTKAQQRRRKFDTHTQIMTDRRETRLKARIFVSCFVECCTFLVHRNDQHSSRHNCELWSFYHLNAINLVRAPFRFVFIIRRNVLYIFDVVFKQIRNASTGFLFLVQLFFFCALSFTWNETVNRFVETLRTQLLCFFSTYL